MKSFELWLETGPLKDEAVTFTTHERRLLNIAYLEGACSAIADHTAALDRLAKAPFGDAASA